MLFNPDLFKTDLFDSKLTNFNEFAESLFLWQLENNLVLSEYYKTVTNPHSSSLTSPLFLPIQFFKTHKVVAGNFESQATFTSSSTTGVIPSSHYVKDISIYHQSFTYAFNRFYGDVKEYTILALLPSYMERSGSSLVMMADQLIKDSEQNESGFYLNEFEKLHRTLTSLKAQKKKTILLGVTFALIDFAESFPIDFPELIVMETGGMKGRRAELIRDEVHGILKKGFGVSKIHSEYGMTELLSQAYSKGDGKFVCPTWMKIIITDPTDPFTKLPNGRSGVINIIDLANIYSCAFIQTSDIGIVNYDGSFEVLGRLDNSDIRGCSLMYL